MRQHRATILKASAFAVAFLIALAAGRQAHAITLGRYCPTAAIPCGPGTCPHMGGVFTCNVPYSTTALHGNCVRVSYPYYCVTAYSCPGTTTVGGFACTCSPPGANSC